MYLHQYTEHLLSKISVLTTHIKCLHFKSAFTLTSIPHKRVKRWTPPMLSLNWHSFIWYISLNKESCWGTWRQVFSRFWVLQLEDPKSTQKEVCNVVTTQRSEVISTLKISNNAFNKAGITQRKKRWTWHETELGNSSSQAIKSERTHKKCINQNKYDWESY